MKAFKCLGGSLTSWLSILQALNSIFPGHQKVTQSSKILAAFSGSFVRPIENPALKLIAQLVWLLWGQCLHLRLHRRAARIREQLAVSHIIDEGPVAPKSCSYHLHAADVGAQVMFAVVQLISSP